ncbi:hypothetical protein ACU5CE_31895, partial [Priestia megaterium]|uniref:hypothetical protein n=1 Tax=Priestia megaterium TaxID=1404 RepID=UPI00406BAE84
LGLSKRFEDSSQREIFKDVKNPLGLGLSKRFEDSSQREIFKDVKNPLGLGLSKRFEDSSQREIFKDIKNPLGLGLSKRFEDSSQREIFKDIKNPLGLGLSKRFEDSSQREIFKDIKNPLGLGLSKRFEDSSQREIFKDVKNPLGLGLSKRFEDTPTIKVPDIVKAGLKLNIPKIQPGEIDYESFYKGSENIGKWGWTVPFSFGLVHIKYFENDNLTKKEVDTFFANYYSSEINEFDKMTNSILKNKGICKWHEAIKQSIYAHKNGKFILSISTLIPTLEGILSTFESNKSNIHMKKVCRNMLEKTDDEAWVDKIMWTSCYHFVSALYERSDFNKEEPEILNRHWILHGRTAFNSSEIDSLRIFNSLETVSGIVKYHNRKRNQNKQDK